MNAKHTYWTSCWNSPDYAVRPPTIFRRIGTTGLLYDSAMLRNVMIVVALSTASFATAMAGSAMLGNADVQLYLTKNKLVTLCAPPQADSSDLQPGEADATTRCIANADFDGDGVVDVAVLIAERTGKQRSGILIKTASGLIRFGAGATTKWRSIDDDGKIHRQKSPLDLQARAALRVFDWSRFANKPVQLKADAIELSGGDASMIIFSDGRRWYAMHAGY